MSDEKRAPPAMWGYCQTVYYAMWEQKNEEEIDGTLVYTWTGYTSRLFQELGVPVPYYGKVLDLLQRMHCLTQLRRGGGTSRSKWALRGLENLTLEAFEEALSEYPEVTEQSLRRQRLERQLLDLQKLVGGIDVPRALTELHSQLLDLQRRVEELESAHRTDRASRDEV